MASYVARRPFNNYGAKMHTYGPNKYIVGALKKRYYKKGYGVSIPKIVRDVKYLKGLINSEPQPFVTTNSNNVDWAGIIVSLSSVPQGDQEGQRTGDRILPRYLNLKGYASCATPAILNCVTYKVMLVRLWTESTSAPPNAVVSDVLSANEISTTFAPIGFLQQNNVGPRGDRQRRIEVLRSEILTCCNNFDSTGVAGGPSGRIQWDWNVEVNGGERKEHIEYIDNNTAQPISGGFYFVIINDVPAASANKPAFYIASKMTFYDN